MKIKPIIAILGLSLMFSGCTKTEKTNISTIDDNSNEIIEVNINEVEKNEHNDMILQYFSDSSDNQYNFKLQTISSNNVTVNYPVITDYDGALTMQYINDSIDSFATNVSEKYSGAENITFNYDITKQSDFLFCIKLTSEPVDSGLVYSEAIIIDMDSTNTVTPELLFLGMQDAVNAVLNKHSTVESETPFDVSDMIMVVEGDNLTFIGKDENGLSDISTVTVPVKDLVDYMSINFGEHPAS